MVKPDPMGATFAERAAAARGDKDFDRPAPEAQDVEDNSTFGDRGSKAVQSDGAENKAVKSAAKKTASKKS
jgi:hypothetical protein